MSDAYTINKRLEHLYGRVVDRDLPRFRVVRSETQVEKRKSQVTEEGLLLAHGHVIREVPKYPYLTPCWLLEVYCSVDNSSIHAEVDAPYTYEPMLPMLDPDDNTLPLSWKAIEFAVQSWLNAERRHRNGKDVVADEEKAIAKEEELVFEELGGKYSIADALHYQEGVFIPKIKEKSNGQSNDSVNLPVSNSSPETGIIP